MKYIHRTFPGLGLALLLALRASSSDDLFVLASSQQAAVCPELAPQGVLFMVGSSVHEVTVTHVGGSFFVDGAEFLSPSQRTEDTPTSRGVGEGYWARVATAALAAAGAETHVQAGDTSGALAASLEDAAGSRREKILEACERHFVHGGLGALGAEDEDALLADRCCDEVQASLLSFYRRPSTPAYRAGI